MSGIYRAASGTFGTVAPEVRAALVDGKPFLMSKKIPLASGTFTADQVKHFGAGFVIDAWLANWDVGVKGQPAADTSGRVLRIDCGGGGLFRARGEPKGAAFGATVGELATMRDPKLASSDAFRTLTDADVKQGLKTFAVWYPAHHGEVEAAIDSSGMSPTLAATFKATLNARAQYLITEASK